MGENKFLYTYTLIQFAEMSIAICYTSSRSANSQSFKKSLQKKPAPADFCLIKPINHDHTTGTNP
jgi:hypothetical protein